MPGKMRDFNEFYNTWNGKRYSTGQCAPGAANWVKAFTGIETSGNGKAYCKDGGGEKPALDFFVNSAICPPADRGRYLLSSEMVASKLIDGDIAGWAASPENPYGHVAMWHNNGWWGQNQGPGAGANGTEYKQPYNGYNPYKETQGSIISIFRFKALETPIISVKYTPFTGPDLS